MFQLVDRARPLKICIVSAEHSPHGGVGNALRQQAALLSAHHEVTLIERPEPSGALARMSFAGEDHLRSAALLEAIEAAYAGGEGPDVLEVCDYRALGLVPLQARAAGHPLLRGTVVAVRASSTAELIALHDGSSMLPGERRVAELEREQFRLADRLFWPGGDVLDLYRRYYGDELLPLPVEVGRPLPVPADPPAVEAHGTGGPLRILYAGRLQRLKGVFDLVEACLGLPGDDWELTMIGADTETATMGQSARLTIEAMCEGDPRVRIEDPLPHEELQRRYADYDLLVSASTFEVCANVVLEAMRAGLPVLATPVGAQTEVIEHGVSGWLAEDLGVEALRSSLGRLLADRGEVERVRASGEVFAAFSRFTDVGPLLRAYESLAGSARTASPTVGVGADEPPVTAVLPYYRAHLYVEDAVGSILAQTHRNLDVVIVNDGSFEPEDAVLDRLSEDPRVQVVNQLNRGDLAARNLGLGLARGEYLLMFDADNVLEPEFVARALAVFRERPQLAYVTCWLRFVDAGGEELDGSGYAPLGNRVLAEEEENWDGDTSALISRRALDRLQPPLAADGPMQGDWLMYRRFRELGEYGAVIPERLVRYRVLSQSLLREHDERLHARTWAEGKDWRGRATTRWTAQA
jgi:glycosyltransferase involved in cell wall biosynthesis